MQESDTVKPNLHFQSSRNTTWQHGSEKYVRNKHALQNQRPLDSAQAENKFSEQDSSFVISKLNESHVTSQDQRPRSLGHLSPPISPPSVIINSPKTSSFQNDYGESMDMAGPSSGRFTSGSYSMRGDINNVSYKHEHTSSQIAKRTLRNTEILPSQTQINIKHERTDIIRTQNAPPPVNRARKPKVFTAPVEIDHKNTSSRLGLEPRNITSNDKISPFSTPPSSDDNTAVDDSPIQDREQKWHYAIREAKKSSHSYPRKDRNNDSDIEGHGYHEKGINLAALNKDHSNNKMDKGDSPPERPSLPPRRDLDAAFASIEPAKRPVVARSSSTNTPQRTNYAEDTMNLYVGNKGIPSRFHTAIQSHQVRKQNTARHSASPVRNSAEESMKSENSQEYSEADQRLQLESRSSSNFPDATNANRRPPRFPERPWEISTGYDTKVFALCGEYLCTTGFITRAWNVRTGQMLVDITHQDTTKVTAIAFRPARHADDEGNCVWLGTNGGDILEVDIPKGLVVSSNGKAHNRREILRIFRYGSNMWSLDDDGKLNIWKPDAHGDIDLPCTPYASRVPRGHSVSLIAEGELWIASGKDIRVFRPETEDKSDFTVLKHPLSQSHIGEITSGATIPSQHDRIYFGHADGKISIYSSKHYRCLNIINLSLYRISSLAGVGDYLWAGFYTGMIYVYDTSRTPWRVLKDWTAYHNHRLAGIVVDRSSVWKMNRLQVASLGTDNMVRIWDGMLRADWLGM